jgi:hypothetical protein
MVDGQWTMVDGIWFCSSIRGFLLVNHGEAIVHSQ